MTAAAGAARRPSVVRALIGVLVLAAGCALLSRGAFFIARAPSECGGAAAPCPDGLAGALVGGVLAFIFVVPVGAALAVRRMPAVPAAAAALGAGAIAAGVYAARFVADPVTDATVVTWILTVLFGGVAVLLALGTLLGTGRRATAARADRTAARRAALERASATADGTTGRPASTGRPAPAARSAPARGPAPATSHEPRTADASRPPRAVVETHYGLTAVHDLLAHGLASGGLASDGGAPAAPGGRDSVVELLDLHRRGVLGDDELRTALRALREG